MLRMKELALLFVSVLAISFAAETLSAQDEVDIRLKSEANKIRHDAVSISMKSIPVEFNAQTPKPIRKIKKHSRPFKVNPTYLQQLEDAANEEGKAIAHADPNASNMPSRPPGEGGLCISYPGVASTDWNPPDPHAAAGIDQIVVVVNSSIAVFYKENGLPLTQVTTSSFFEPVSPPSTFIYDPKVVYDPHEDRFIILYLCTDDISQSSYLVAVSESGDAMGNWWLYNLDASMNGSTPVDEWADYPGLGFDYSDAVYVTSNQWGFTSGFQYSKIRILKKEELYAGSITGWYDFWDMRYHDNGVVFTIKPAVTLSDAGGEYLLSNIWYGANYTTYWKITDAASETPTLTRMPKVNLSATYSIPPNPVQAGSNARLSPVGPMTQDVFFRNGKLYTAFSQSYNWDEREVSAVRLIGIDTGTSVPFLDEIYGAAIVKPVIYLSRFLWLIVDVVVIDGLINGLATIYDGSSEFMSKVQTGRVRSYATLFVIGVVILIAYMVME